MLQLRDYQVGTELKIIAATARARRIACVAPTGSGKTLIASSVISSNLISNLRTIFEAPRREIIEQTYRKLTEDCGISPSLISVAMANDKRWDPARPIQVASSDTLHRRIRVHDLRPNLIVVDEAHRRMEATKRLQEQFPEAWFLLLTATPWRTDGHGLHTIADEMIVAATVAELMKDGWLCGYEAWTVPKQLLPDLAGLKPDGSGDWPADQVAQRSDKPRIVGSLVETWEKRAFMVPTLCFAANVEHSKSIVRAFLAADIAAEHVDAGTPDDIRAAILGPGGRLATGETQVVSNVGIAGEGYDAPCVGCVIMARSTKSLALHIQHLGRGLRLFGDKVCVFLDHAGNFDRFPLPDDPLPYSLGGLEKTKLPKASRCGKCYAIFPGGLTSCPRCGEKKKIKNGKREKLKELGGDLVRLVARSGEEYSEDQRKHFQGLCFNAGKFSKGREWVRTSFVKRWGKEMPQSWLFEIPGLMEHSRKLNRGALRQKK